MPPAQLSKMLLINLSMISRPLIYLRVNTSNLLLPLVSGTRWDSLMRTKCTSWIQILPKSVLLLNALGPLWARFPNQFLKNWNQARQNISTLNFMLHLPRLHLLAMPLLKSANIAWSQPLRRLSLRSRKVPILRKQLNVDMNKPVNKTVLIQHRALTCQIVSPYTPERAIYHG